MEIIYDNIWLKPIGNFECRVDSVYDDAGVDFLYQKFSIQGGFLVNGQVDCYGNMPATSYIRNGAPDITLGDLGGNPAPVQGNADIDAEAPPGLQGGGGWVVPPAINLAQVNGLRGTPDLSTNTDPWPVGSTLQNPPNQNAPAAGISAGVPQFMYTVTNAPNAPNASVYAIRMRLGIPRKQLFVFYNQGDINELLVATPSPGAVCDANNGPKPICFDICQSVGEATLFCNWQCEAYINESAQNCGTAPALLSNRFRQKEHLSENFGIIRETEGSAIFRTDVVLDGFNPDTLRGWLFPPIPRGYVRKVEVEGLPGVNGVHWRTVDTQQESNFVAGPTSGATKIEVLHRQAITSGNSVLSGTMQSVERLLNIQMMRKNS